MATKPSALTHASSTAAIILISCKNSPQPVSKMMLDQMFGENQLQSEIVLAMKLLSCPGWLAHWGEERLAERITVSQRCDREMVKQRSWEKELKAVSRGTTADMRKE